MALETGRSVHFDGRMICLCILPRPKKVNPLFQYPVARTTRNAIGGARSLVTSFSLVSSLQQEFGRPVSDFSPDTKLFFFLLCEPAALILFFAEWKKRALYVSVFCLSYVILITIFHQTVHTNTHTQTPIRSMYSLTSISVLRKFVPIVVVSTPHRGN